MSAGKPVISSKADARIRWVSTLAMIIVALAAAVLSWHGLTMLGEQAGFGNLSILLPLVIDGTMLVGALHVLHASLTGLSTRWGWGMTLVGVAFSTWGNVAGASTTGIASGIVHAIPALALAASVEATMRIIRHGIAVTHAAPAVAQLSKPVPSPPPGGGHPLEDPADLAKEQDAPTDPLPTSAAIKGEPEAQSSEHVAPAPETQPTSSPAPVRRPEPAHASTTATKAVVPYLRAVTTQAPGVPEDLRALAAWVRARKAAGQSDSAAWAHRAGVATSQSTAKRALARLRADYPNALVPIPEEETGS